MLQTAVGVEAPLASGPTLSRLDTTACRQHVAALHEVFIAQFIARHSVPPKPIILEVDATHVPLRGQQEGGHFSVYYNNYCYLPLYVFAGQHLLACVLRPCDRDPASVFSALVKLLSRRLRQAWRARRGG